MTPSSSDTRMPSVRRLLGAFVLAGAMLLPGAVAAQQGSVTGVVREAGSQRPLDAVQVYVPGTGIGTLTNASGRYLLLNVPVGQQTIRAELVGYAPIEQTVTVTAGSAASADLMLRTRALQLDEIIVTGTGQATERKRLGNTVATLDVSQLENAPINDVTDLLTGREPGVIAAPSGGMAGEGSSIRIRGSSSLSQTNEPIVYVDGIRIDASGGSGGAGSASRLNDINPESIERVEILKGAAAATLYGTEASNGVIQIFTKRGRAGTPRWEANIEQGWNEYVSSRLEPHAGYGTTQARADELSSLYGVGPLQPYQVFTKDLFPYLTETGHSQSYSLSVSGGSDLINYYVSGRYANVDGPYGGEDLGPAEDVDEKKQATATLTIFPTDNLRVRVNSMYTQGYHAIPTNGNNTTGGWSLLVMSRPGQYGREGNYAGVGAFTTVKETMQLEEWEDLERFTGGVSANYEPLDRLVLDATVGVDMVNQQGRWFAPFGWAVEGVAGYFPQGARDVTDLNRNEVTFDGKASYQVDLTDQFDADLIVGAQLQSMEQKVVGGSGEDFPAPGLEVAEAGANQDVDESYLATVNAGLYGQGQVGFRDYLFVTGGVRFDQHSAFGESAGAAVYPKASVSWVASDMPGWNNLGPINSLRFRGAWGQSGLQPGAFDAFTTFSPQPSLEGPGVQPDNLGNPDLQPEVSTEWEAGLEFGMFGDRVALDATYWNRTVDDVLVARQFPPSGGFLSTQLDNLGQMKAHGLEIGLQGNAVSRPGFSLDLFANAAYLQEEVTDMGGAPPIKVGYYRYRTWIAEGYAPGSFFTVKLADAPNPFDINNDGQPDTDQEILDFLSVPRSPDALRLALAEANPDGPGGEYYRGKPMPDWQGAFGGDIRFLENFRLSSMMEYKFGNFFRQNLSGAFRNTHGLLGRNTQKAAEVEAILANPGSTAQQRLDAAQVWARELVSLSPYSGLNAIEEADLLRWRELSLTYTVPGSLVERLRVDRVSLTLAARNLALWTDYTGIDPDSNVTTQPEGGNSFVYGIDGWRPPVPRTFSFSARVGW